MPLTLLPPPLTREDALTRRLESLSGRWWRAVCIRAISQLLVLCLAVVVLVTLLDQRLTLPALVRAGVLVTFLVGGVLLTRRWLVVPLAHVGGPLTIAHRIEQRFPEFNDSLLSAVQFLQQPLEAQTCSPSLRHAAIRRALKKAERYDFDVAIPTRGVKRWSMVAALMVAMVVWFVQSDPAIALTAVQRLAVPFGGTAVRTQTQIDVLQPTFPHRLARGEALDIKVRFTGVLPERATVSIQLESGAVLDQAYPVPHEDGNVVETIFRLDANRLAKDVQFRIRANDASSPWYRVSVHPPPVFVPLNGRPSPQIHLEFPTYTDLPATELTEGSGIVDCIAGTRVTIRAATDRPVQKAWIVWQPEQPTPRIPPLLAVFGASSPLSVPGLELLAREVVQPVPVAISDHGQRLEVTFVPRVQGPYAFRFEDDTGLGGTRTFDVRVHPDPAPEIQLHEPAPQREIMLLPDAEFTLRTTVKDEKFAVRRVTLEARTNNNARGRERILYDAPTVSALLPQLAHTMRGFGPLVPVRLRLAQVSLQERLQVSQFCHPDGSSLKEGDLLFLTVLADDFDDVTGFKQPGRSATLVIQIVSKADLEAVLQQAQSDIRGELLRLHAQQRVARNAVQDVQRQLQTTGLLRPDDREQLNNADQTQQLIRAKLNDTPDGLRAQLQNLKQLAADNRLPRSPATERLNDARAELDRLAMEELEPLQSDLNAARTTDDKSTQQEALNRTQKRQKEVEQTFQGLLERLEPWSGLGEIRGETRSIANELKRNIDKVLQFAEQMPANKAPEQLTPQVKADLERSALNDERVAERVRQMIEKINRLALDKENAAQEKRNEATRLETQAQAMQDQAAKGSPEEQAAKQQALELRERASNATRQADDLKREAQTLRMAAQAGNSEELKEQLRGVGSLTRQNQLHQAATQQQAAVRNLERMLQAMDDQQQDDLDRLTKSLKKADQELDNVIDEQEQLQKKIRAAQQLSDPAERQAALEKLTRQQEQLEERTRELAQRLARNQGEEAAQELRRAAREMAQARDQLEAGERPTKLDDALERLDNAQAKLDDQRDQNNATLQREQAAKVGDKIKNLRDRQQRLNEEALRLHTVVKRDKKWERAMRASLNDLRQQQEALAPDVRKLLDNDFAKAAVFNRMLRQAAAAMELAGKRLDARLESAEVGPFDLELEDIADTGIRQQQQLALKRFDQLLEALKPDQQPANPPASPMGMNEQPPIAGQPMGPRLPPLAQLKALRELQADIAERTALFDKAHPDLTKLNDDEVAELEALMKMQVDVADLIKELTAIPQGAMP